MATSLKTAPIPVAGFPVVDGSLTVGGIPLLRLAERAGRTPFYAYDRASLTRRVGQLRAAMPAGVHLSYAVKANPMPAVLHHLAGLVDGFDVASSAELTSVLNTSVGAQDVSFAGPGKTDAELSQAVASGVLLNLESEHEMETVARIGARQGVRPRVAVRVNPDFDLKASGMKMAGGAKQFGVDAERVPQMLSHMRQLDLAFEGFHIFAGSQNLHADLISDVQQKTIALAIELAGHAPAPVRTLNIGGGFGIPYHAGDVPLDLAAVGGKLGELMPKVSSALPEAKIVVELGRYIVGEAGVYVCRVLDRKFSRGQVFLVTDGGLHHHLVASGNLGVIIRRNFPVAVGNRMGEKPAETATVVGCLCTPFDLLADKVELPRTEVGDLIVIFQSGAYGASASPQGFLSHPGPAEILV
jgi:diaminopimelate decarboxylase